MQLSTLCLLLPVMLLSCVAPEPARPNGLASPDPKASVTKEAPEADLVDCNYYWPARRRHVCIKDMPVTECEDLFFMAGFQREKECVCDATGREKNRIDGGGYIQYDCE